MKGATTECSASRRKAASKRVTMMIGKSQNFFLTLKNLQNSTINDTALP
jgi:hypothetical protein